jgi:hypothetical protein
MELLRTILTAFSASCAGNPETNGSRLRILMIFSVSPVLLIRGFFKWREESLVLDIAFGLFLIYRKFQI